MPQKQHLPSVSDKEQRMYEHIKESELKQGRPTKRAKAIAAATVVKHHNARRHAKKYIGSVALSASAGPRPGTLEATHDSGRIVQVGPQLL